MPRTLHLALPAYRVGGAAAVLDVVLGSVPGLLRLPETDPQPEPAGV
jgi:hypothetical protein